MIWTFILLQGGFNESLAAGEDAARYCTPRARGTEVDLDLLAAEHPDALRQVYGVVRSQHDRLNRPAV